MTKLLGLPMKFLAIMFTFMAAVSWMAAKSAILFVAPILVYSLSGLAILSAAVAAFTFCAWRFNWAATKIEETKRDRTLARNEAKLSDIGAEREHVRMIAEARLLGATIKQVERGLIHPAALGEGSKFSSFPAQIINKIESGVPLLESGRRDLLPALANSPNVLIVGGRGRGKTALLQWLEYERLQDGIVVTILDSHAKPAQWGGQVIGAGRQYESIARAMIDLNTMLDNRFVGFSNGKDDFSRIDTFIDEFTLLPGYLKEIGYDIQRYSKPALTEGRKVKMNCVWGIHSDRATALGLKGAKDLLECFDAIVYLKKVQGDYYAMINFGEGIEDTKYNHPGKFTIDRPTSKVKILSLPTPAAGADPIAVTNWPKAAPSPEDTAAVESFIVLRDSDKFSWRKATQAAFGAGKFGDSYNQKLRSILDKFSVDYSGVDT